MTGTLRQRRVIDGAAMSICSIGIRSFSPCQKQLAKVANVLSRQRADGGQGDFVSLQVNASLFALRV
jgi:hypothetical protein